MCAVDAMHVQVHREWGAAGIRAVAPAHLPHPRVAGRRIMEPPLCTRPSVFSPGFFHRLATRRGAAGAPFVDRIRVGVRVSKPSPFPRADHLPTPAAGDGGGRRGGGEGEGGGEATAGQKMRARLSITRARNHAYRDIKLLNYTTAPSSRPRTPTTSHLLFRQISR